MSDAKTTKITQRSRQSRRRGLESMFVPPMQRRAMLTLEAIYNATVKLVSAQGFEATTITQVIAESGTSSGALYQRFRSKAALCEYVHIKWIESTTQIVDRLTDPIRFEDVDLAQTIRTIYRFFGRPAPNMLAFRTAVFHECIRNPSFRERQIGFRNHVNDRYVALLTSKRAEVTHPDADLAIAFASRQIIESNTMRFDLPEFGISPKISDRLYEQQAVEAVTLYLMGDRQQPPVPAPKK